ncbi:hypothetical protein BSKO_10171 [Bryopsis sp. KO-2023]|nr:hypothetical protein BSKO_10171 [Bryopsis sp. KO-2023]
MKAWLKVPCREGVQLDVCRDDTVEDLVRWAEDKLGSPLPWHDWWFECCGRVASLESRLGNFSTSYDSITVSARGRFRGGGGDGGSTGAESRDCYLDMYKEKRASKVDASEEKLAKWTRCQLSGEALSPPCVCDGLGTLFNKDAVLKALISKSLPDSLKHIRKLKDVTDLKLTPNPHSKRKAEKTTADDKNYQLSNEATFCCPVSGLEFNGSCRFLVHRETGHAVSERAIKGGIQAVKDVIGGKDCGPDQWIVLNGSEEEVKALRDGLIEKRGLLKKDKKRKKEQKEQGDSKKQKVLKATEFTPELASKDVYHSLFNSSRGDESKETYLCRSTAARGMNLT